MVLLTALEETILKIVDLQDRCESKGYPEEVGWIDSRNEDLYRGRANVWKFKWRARLLIDDSVADCEDELLEIEQ